MGPPSSSVNPTDIPGGVGEGLGVMSDRTAKRRPRLGKLAPLRRANDESVRQWNSVELFSQPSLLGRRGDLQASHTSEPGATPGSQRASGELHTVRRPGS